MDPNDKSLTAVNVIDSLSISSLTSSLEDTPQPEITGGPINRLPNEILQLIMAKLGVDRDVKKLIRLRLVSTRWRSVIEDYCELKKSLFVHCTNMFPMDFSSNYFHYLKKVFFGFVKSSDFPRLFLSTKLPSECLSTLLNLFPNVVQLCIDFNETTLAADFTGYINSLDSLKLLDVHYPQFTQITPLLAQLSQTLSKLDHFSFGCALAPDALNQIVSRLVPTCVRVQFEHDIRCVYDDIRQWQNINPSWLANLTHLQMYIRCNSETFAQVVYFLVERATSLQCLRLYAMDQQVTRPLKMTATVIEQLGKLTQLANVVLQRVEMDICLLEQAAAQLRLTSLTSILTCNLYIVGGRSMNADQFTRVLSVIFPNLVELILVFGRDFARMPFRAEIEQHLNRFPNLRKHEIHFY